MQQFEHIFPSCTPQSSEFRLFKSNLHLFPPLYLCSYNQVVEATLASPALAADARAKASAVPTLPDHAGASNQRNVHHSPRSNRKPWPGTLTSMWIMGCLIGHHEAIARAVESKLCSMMKAVRWFKFFCGSTGFEEVIPISE
jgi:hypothetical protein